MSIHVRILSLYQNLKANSRRSLHKYAYAMNKAYFRRIDGEEQFQITFQLTNPDLKVNRQFNFCRKLSENVETFLKRINTNLEKAINKKKKKNEKSDGLNVNSSLLNNSNPLNGDTLCEELFLGHNGDFILKLLDTEYNIVINSPWIDGISLSNCILANFPTYPTKFESVFTDKDVSEFSWYASRDKKDWVQVGDGFVYIPTNNEINSFLKLTCVPKNLNAEGPAVEIVSTVAVEASPGICPFENRHNFTKHKTSGNRFRVVTYNILADLYCDSDFSRNVLYPYCPPYALHIDYRKQLILKELLGYNADIICLQEVDRKVFAHDLEPVFKSQGYDANFTLKGGLVAEGVVCMYNKNRFRNLMSDSILLCEQLDKNPIFSKLWEIVLKNEKLSERVLSRTTALQITALQSTERNEIILVANTHFYFHPDADHIRLLQGSAAILYIENVFETLKVQYPDQRISLIFCGDFNSVPECGIYQLFTTGNVSENCVDWKSNLEEAVENLSVSQPFQLSSACGTPPFTNYTAGFSGCLDYIFFEKDKLQVEQVIPLPSQEEITQHTALPSVVFPSDHISLVSDLKWI